MEITAEAQELAGKILDYIEEHPEQHNQKYWVRNARFGDRDDAPTALRKAKEVNFCGTTMCIAGTAVFLGIPEENWDKVDSVEHTARELLGIDEYDDAHHLFYSDDETSKRLIRAMAEGDEAEFEAIVEHSWTRVE